MVNPKNGEYDDLPHIGPGNIESFTGRILNNIKSVKEDNLISEKFLFNAGDIIYGKINPQLGKYVLIDFEGLASADTYILNTKNGLTQNFLFRILQGRNFYKYTVSVSMRTGIPKINRDELKRYKFSLPKLKEQEKIGEFFKQIDQTIDLHQRKLELLKQMKNGFLQVMFPQKGEAVPKLRFANFDGEWELCKLGQVAKYRNGKAHEKDISKYGKYIVINSKFVSTNGKVKKFSDKQIEPLKQNEIAFVLSDVPNGRALARTFLVNENNKYSLNQRIAGITPQPIIDAYFLYVLMNRHPYFLRFDNGVGQTNLSKLDVENFVERYPTFEEQNKIGTFLRQLDDTIALYQNKLHKIQSLKKAFLQKMFI